MTSSTGSSVSIKVGNDFVVTLVELGQTPTLVFENRDKSLLKAMAVIEVGGALSLGWLARDPQSGVSSAKINFGHQAFLIVWRPTTSHPVQSFDVIAVEK